MDVWLIKYYLQKWLSNIYLLTAIFNLTDCKILKNSNGRKRT